MLLTGNHDQQTGQENRVLQLVLWWVATPRQALLAPLWGPLSAASCTQQDELVYRICELAFVQLTRLSGSIVETKG